MSNAAHNTVICTYRVKEGEEEQFRELLSKHWSTLHRLGLTTDDPTTIYRGVDSTGGVFFVEIFTWVDDGASAAHEHPAVAAIWEPMAQLTEPRLGRRAMEFPHVEPISLDLARID